MVEEKAISTGMIPKLSSCVHALEAGVGRAHIINGTIDNALILELLTDKGIGTMVTGNEGESSASQPLGNFAAKLLENLD
ncbi:MAG: acetylglutamate kinase, partial [Eggerthellaceae bacterium]|nr:acetylglutamate kinase [Eggerthellaceae bacterium]